MMNIFNPKMNGNYNFSDDSIYNIILEKRKRFIIKSTKNRASRQRHVSKNLYCGDANRYLIHLNELQIELNVSR